jgi:hypothetical protein
MLYLTLTLKREQINYRAKVAIEKIYRYWWWVANLKKKIQKWCAL